MFCLTKIRPLLILIGIAFLLFFSSFGTLSVGAAPLPNAKIIVNVPSRTLMLYSGNTLVKTYPVGVGTANFPTPMGSFKIEHMVVDPKFESPFSGRHGLHVAPRRGPLGTRWMGFLSVKDGEYGIHGTYEDGSVGQFSSHGCIRMHIHDAEALFEKIDFDTPVDIVYDFVEIDSDGADVSLSVYPAMFGYSRPDLNDIAQKIIQRYPGAHLEHDRLVQAIYNAEEHPVVVGHIEGGTEQPNLSVSGRVVPPANDPSAGGILFRTLDGK